MPYYAFPCQADHGATSVVQTERGDIIARCDLPPAAVMIATALDNQAQHMARADAFAGMLTALNTVAAIIGNVQHKGGGSNSAKMYADMLNDIRSIAQPAVAAATAEHIPQPAPPTGGNAAPAEDFAATEWEIQTAREVWADDELRIDDDAEVSRGNDGTWVQAWVLIENEADQDHECPHCGETAQDGSGTCITCGQDMSEEHDAND